MIHWRGSVVLNVIYKIKGKTGTIGSGVEHGENSVWRIPLLDWNNWNKIVLLDNNTGDRYGIEFRKITYTAQRLCRSWLNVTLSTKK